MKDHLFQLLEGVSIENRLNLAREYLQIYCLRLLQETSHQSRLCFVGGTALRILHRLPRFSEDLDFSVAPDQLGLPFDSKILFLSIKNALSKTGYNVEAKTSLKKTVANAFFKFNGLPLELGLTRDRRRKLSIKLEIDQNPPEGAKSEITLVQRFFPIAINHYDLPSLFAGKLHALLARPYAKGRDWYDLVWYLTEKSHISPNMKLLNNALEQTNHRRLESDDWTSAILNRMQGLDWNMVINDVAPFLERPSDLVALEKSHVVKIINGLKPAK